MSKAVGKYIVVKPIYEDLETASGFSLGAADEKTIRYRKGEVISAGGLVEEIKGGMVVFYDKHAGHRMLLNGEDVQVIMERDVVLIW